MTIFLSPEWIAEYIRLSSTLPRHDDVDAVLQNIVGGAPNGGSKDFYQVIKDGVTVEIGLGHHPDPDITLEQKYDVALKVACGELAPTMAVMTRRIKPKGDVTKLMGMLPVSRTPEYRAMESAVAAMTMPEEANR